VTFFQRNAFWLERLQSLTGVVPIGAFIVFHFYENGKVLQGAQAYNDASAGIRQTPFLLFFEIALIYLPILYHTIYGLRLFGVSRPNNRSYRYRRNTFYTVQRLTGIILILFIGFHVVTFRFGQFINSPPTFGGVLEQLSNPLVFVWFLIGVAAASLHLANGLWSFLVRWGVTVGPTSQHRSAYVMAVVFVLLTAAGWAVCTAFFLSARQLAALPGLAQ